MDYPLPFKAIAAFHATARHGTVTRAGEVLGVSPSAVSQQIRLLEHHLATTLFLRQNRRMVLTEAGERYFESISTALDMVDTATRRMRGYKAANVLLVRAAPSFATKWILPRLDDFLAREPNLGVRLDATNEPTDFDRDGVDLEIRYGQGEWPGFYVESLVEDEFRPMLSPALLAKPSLTVRDIAGFRLIQSVKALASWSQFFHLHGLPERTAPAAGLQFDRSYMAVDAAANGLGMAFESTLLAHRELASGRLVCPVTDARPVAVRAHWLVCPHRHLRLRKVERFMAWLRETLARR
ncbi:LysR substrate-binding domain-containing protein [Xanthobacter sp. KR7-65]|uniref:LysR substrate-binding domain-containing protein n=1 Tax=Xanthobacter sp. KR7-65 TaxID=3156612 RepID=UPI0032B56445